MRRPKHQILGKEFDGMPGIISLAQASDNQREVNEMINRFHNDQSVAWSVSGDREHRGMALYSHSESIAREGRTVHVGLDINVPVGTALYAPFDCEVITSEYEAGPGNYGWMCVLRCDDEGQVFYLMFGHLAQDGLAPVGAKLCAGDVFAKVGDFHENGGYWHHTHLQVLTERGFKEGWAYKALCRPDEVKDMDALCPSPMFLVIPIN